MLKVRNLVICVWMCSLCVALESTNNQKLMLEYEKYQELQGKSQRMQEDYERQLSEMEEKREQALQALTEYYEAKIQELTSKLEQVSSSFPVICLTNNNS